MRFLTFYVAVAALASLALAQTDDSQGGYQGPQTGDSQGVGGYQGPQTGDSQGPQTGDSQGVGGYQGPQTGDSQGVGGYQGPQSGGYQGAQTGSSVVDFQESGGYGYEVIARIKVRMRVEIREAYVIPLFQYPPLSDRVRGHMRRFGHELKAFFGKVGRFFRKVGHAIHMFFHKLKVGVKKMVRKVVHGVEIVTEDVFEGVVDVFNCLASAVHVQFRKCKSDWERAKFWASCEAAHFKHWYEYRRLVREGKRRIYTRFQHDMLCAMEKFELSMNGDFKRREQECASVQDVYTEHDIVYMETVGYGEYKAPYGAD